MLGAEAIVMGKSVTALTLQWVILKIYKAIIKQ